MAITSLSGSLASTLTHDTSRMRNNMADLQRQLGTGRRAENYADLGPQRRLSVSFRQTISQVESWQQSIKQVDLRINIADVALTRMTALRTDAKAAIDPNTFNLNGSGKTTDQQVGKILLSEFHSLLKTDVAGRFIFGGRDLDAVPVEELETILYGNGVQDGVNTYIDQRKDADLGVNGLGRITTPARVGTTVSFAGEAPATMPFGAKITAITSDAPAMVANIVPAVGAVPAAASVNFAAQPNPGQEVRISFTLPNGKSETISLNASTLINTDDNTFQIGATPADTAQNFRDKLESHLRLHADTSVAAASSLQASYEFFKTHRADEPMRVAGVAPFTGATALVAGTPANTVEWYKGEDGDESPRTGAVTRVDRESSVSYGMRANEDPFAWMMAQFSAFFLDDYSADTREDKERHTKMAEMINQNMSDRPGNPLVESIHIEITSAHMQSQRAAERHEITTNQYKDLTQDIENISQEEVATSILSLQTQIETSYAVTARLSQLSLVNFLR